ncbi:CBS domain-containing protein [Rhizobium sp. RAF56]|uniref:CBS domain-containing protein n=1 Tax=Rhizobium sp. RAF56 TaxID=3233062 RepID=UPI003F94F45E
MISPVTTITEDQHIRRAIEIVNSSKIRAVPVVNDQGMLAGIVTEGDLLRRIVSSGAARPVPPTRARDDLLANYIKARS